MWGLARGSWSVVITSLARASMTWRGGCGGGPAGAPAAPAAATPGAGPVACGHAHQSSAGPAIPEHSGSRAVSAAYASRVHNDLSTPLDRAPRGLLRGAALPSGAGPLVDWFLELIELRPRCLPVFRESEDRIIAPANPRTVPFRTLAEPSRRELSSDVPGAASAGPAASSSAKIMAKDVAASLNTRGPLGARHTQSSSRHHDPRRRLIHARSSLGREFRRPASR